MTAKKNEGVLGVFTDGHKSVEAVRKLKEEGYTGQVSDLVINLTQAVRARYDLVETSQA